MLLKKLKFSLVVLALVIFSCNLGQSGGNTSSSTDSGASGESTGGQTGDSSSEQGADSTTPQGVSENTRRLANLKLYYSLNPQLNKEQHSFTLYSQDIGKTGDGNDLYLLRKYDGNGNFYHKEYRPQTSSEYDRDTNGIESEFWADYANGEWIIFETYNENGIVENPVEKNLEESLNFGFNNVTEFPYLPGINFEFVANNQDKFRIDENNEYHSYLAMAQGNIEDGMYNQGIDYTFKLFKNKEEAIAYQQQAYENNTNIGRYHYELVERYNGECLSGYSIIFITYPNEQEPVEVRLYFSITDCDNTTCPVKPV